MRPTLPSTPTSSTTTTSSTKKISSSSIQSRTETGLRVDEIIQEATASEIEECDNGTGASEHYPMENSQKLYVYRYKIIKWKTIRRLRNEKLFKFLYRPKKPPFTYTELIEYALEDKGELTVSGIYQWIS